MSRIPITYFPPHVLTIKTPSEWVVQERGTCIHNFHRPSMYFDCSSYIFGACQQLCVTDTP
jgi:hypothetical protein